MTLGKRKERDEQEQQIDCPVSHGTTLFVSNLPYSTTSVDLQTLFSDIAPLRSAFVVTEHGTGISKGVGYVSFSMREDAEAAHEKISKEGIIVAGRKLRVDWADHKLKHKLKEEDREMKKASHNTIQRGHRDFDPVRTIVMSGLPQTLNDKQLWKKIRKHEGLEKLIWPLKVEDGTEDPKTAHALFSTPSAANDAVRKLHAHVFKGSILSVTLKERFDNLGKSEVDVKSINNREEDEESDEVNTLLGYGGDDGRRKPVKPSLPGTDVGTTVFVRNIPFTATENELRTLFQAFGPLRYARITMDPETSRSRGTGFVCFWNREDAERVIERSDLLRIETTGDSPVALKKNPFVLPSILTPDPSSSLAQNLVLHGRALDVVRAVTRDQAQNLKEQGERARQKADKRNVYLLKEGVVLPNSLLAQNLSSVDLGRRMNSYNTRRALLKSNPSLFISRTRLSVRQIPLFVTERVLRRLSLHAIRAFETDVEEGIRSGLSPDECADVPPTTDEYGGEFDNKNYKNMPARATGVKQAKVVRQQDRIDPVTGKGRSKGYGFIEMKKHSDALRVLRWVNCNSDVGPLLEQWHKEEIEDLLRQEKSKNRDERADRRIERLEEESGKRHLTKGKVVMIVEFSIENVQVVQRRHAKQNELRYEAPKEHENQNVSLISKEELSLSRKKRRISTGEVGTKVGMQDGKPKAEQHFGSIIARKRKERRKGKKGVRTLNKNQNLV